MDWSILDEIGEALSYVRINRTGGMTVSSGVYVELTEKPAVFKSAFVRVVGDTPSRREIAQFEIRIMSY